MLLICPFTDVPSIKKEHAAPAPVPLEDRDILGDLVVNDIDTDADLVSNNIEVNGLNKLNNQDNEVVANDIAFGSVNVVIGSSGNTNNYNQGDVANVIGMVQGFWDSVDIADVSVDLNSDGHRDKQPTEMQ